MIVGPAPHLDHALHVGDDEFRVLLGHHVRTGDDGGRIGDLQLPVRVSGQVFHHPDFSGVLLQVLEHLALGIDGIDLSVQQRRLHRAEGQVALVVARGPEVSRIDHGRQHLRVVVPVIRVREFDDFDIVDGHVVHHEHAQDAHVLLDAPPVILERVQALREGDLFAFQVFHPVDRIAFTHCHAAALVDPRRTQQPGAAACRHAPG